MVLCFLCVFWGTAQNISVRSFRLDEKDLTAQKNSVDDGNGEKCALIRVQTTQKGFSFDVGSLGVEKIDENHVGEIWVYVPHSVKHISIRHPKLGSLSNYDFPVAINKAKTYIMEITSDKVFVNNYDDTRMQRVFIKVFPSNSSLIVNGARVSLNGNGEVYQDLATGTHTYKVESKGYYTKEGQFEVSPDVYNKLLISDLRPIIGKLAIYVNPQTADVSVDGKFVGRSLLNPIELQIGTHEITVSAKGYQTEKRTVQIEEGKTQDIRVTLSRFASFKFSSNPSFAYLSIDGQYIGTTPCSKTLTTGIYVVEAKKPGYKDYKMLLELSSSNPYVNIKLKEIYNSMNELYLEGNAKVGNFLAMGATLGVFIHNINIEASYLYGLGNSELIYWCNENSRPVETTYSPLMSITTKFGYGIALGTRFRFAPQVGVNFLKLTENQQLIGNGANSVSSLVGCRLSFALFDHIALTLSPEYLMSFKQSEGYNTLSKISPKINSWDKGFNIKMGIATFF